MPDHLGEDMRKVKNEEEKEEKEIKCELYLSNSLCHIHFVIVFSKDYFLNFQHWMKATSLC